VASPAQQKVVLAKWLRTEPNVLVLDEPTGSVDVGAKAAIYGLLRDATQRGMAVLVNSSDTKELAELCDRVLVLDRGRQVAEFQGPQRQGLPCRHHAGITQASRRHHAGKGRLSQRPERRVCRLAGRGVERSCRGTFVPSFRS
jgi:ABC-type multidrug transport system ATPase subunit